MGIAQAITLLWKCGISNLNVLSMELDYNGDSTHIINHRFRQEVILPYIGISDNLRFMLSKGETSVLTSDGILCKVIEKKQKHVCELGEDITRIYQISPWDFIMRWYSVDNRMDTMEFIYLKLTKVDG